MSGYTVEDFEKASFARHENGSVAARAGSHGMQWLANFLGVSQWKIDLEMAADGGWVPVVESRITEGTLRHVEERAERKRERLVDHIADQDRVIRRRNDEITALRLELADAQAPLSLDSLAAAWEAAEQADECREGDVLIIRDDEDNYLVRRMEDRNRLDSTARILSRAPREPWVELAGVLHDVINQGGDDRIDVGSTAARLYAEGVRVTGGDE